MQKLAQICIDRPVFATMLVMLMVVAGAVGFFKLPVDRYPAVDLPTVTVRTVLPGAAPEEVEVTVSQPIEEAVNTVEGITELRSISGPGSSLVLATFSLDRDIDLAAQDVRDRLSQALRELPRDAEPPVVGKFDNDSSPALTIAVAGERPLRELTELADKRVRPALERCRGVGGINLEGGFRRAINVELDAGRLAAYGLTAAQVQDAVRRQNSDVPGGNVTDAVRERTLRTMGRYADPRAFSDLVVAVRNGVPIRIADIGRAEDGVEEVRSIARLDGLPTVVLDVRRTSGANTIAVIAEVKRAMEAVAKTLPSDVRLEIVRDQSRYIEAALHEIEFHLIAGALLASFVVLLFLRSWRATIVAAVAIPASVITTFALMWAFGFTLNSITMLALVLMVGVVIDDAIVVLENVHRWAHEKGVSPFEAARGATKEIGLAVLATTLSLVVIFVPISFLSSISGRFLYQFGITSAAAILVSLVVSFSLTPMMSARMLQGGALFSEARSSWWERVYMRVLDACRKRPIATFLASGLVVAATVPLYGMVKQDYIPSDVDEGEFEVRANGPEGTSVAAMDRAFFVIEEELRKVPAVRSMLTNVGGGFLGGVNQGSIYVRIAPFEERRFSVMRLLSATLAGDPLAAWRGNYTQTEVMSDIRKRLRQFPGLRCSVRNQRSFNIGGGNFDIDFSIRGPQLEALADYAERLRDRAGELGGIVDLDTTLRIERPELRVEIDRERAAALGVDTQDIALSLRLLVGGDPEVGRFRDPQLDEEYDVRLRLREADRTDPESFQGLLVSRSSGPPVRLDSVAKSLDDVPSASRIDRFDRQRESRLRGGIGPGYALADRIAALRQAADELGMPQEYSTAVSGRARELEATFDEFVIAFLLSILFMYMILAAQFESLWQPFVILLALPVAAPFALLSLVTTGETLNLYSALGVLVLFGMVKKNAILQVDHSNQLLQKGCSLEDAVRTGSRDRLRPILMTTFAFVFGMLPLAIGSGPGAEERKAISVVVIGGQMLSLLLSLVLTPVAYEFVQKRLRATRSAQ